MKTFIVPDIHGHYETLFSLLEKAGVIDADGNRQDGWRVIQLGDLANCVAADVDGDVACLKTVSEFGWIDEMLIGNHEHPYFGGPEFGGFMPDPKVREELNKIERQGRLSPSALVGKNGDILVTHAGYVPTHGVESAPEGHEYALDAWSRDKQHPLFSQISFARGGNHKNGGILWSDWMEAKANSFNQIVGHTPQKNGVQRRQYDSTGKWTICIDVGAKFGKGAATGIVLDEDDNLKYVSIGLSGNHW